MINKDSYNCNNQYNLKDNRMEKSTAPNGFVRTNGLDLKVDHLPKQGIAGGRIGFSGNGSTYVGPTYTGSLAGGGHTVGIEARHYSGDSFTSIGANKGFRGGPTTFHAGFGFRF